MARWLLPVVLLGLLPASASAAPLTGTSWRVARVEGKVVHRSARERLAWIITASALVAVVALAVPAARHLRESVPDPPPVRFEIATPTGGMVGAWAIGSATAITLLAAALRVVAALERRAGAAAPA